MAGVKGKSGRKPNEPFFAKVLEEWLDGTEVIDGTIRGRAEAIIAAMGKKALEGDMAAIREIMDRVDGKVTQPMDHTGTIEVRGVEMTFVRPDTEAQHR